MIRMDKQFNERKCLFVISFTLLGFVFLFSSSAAAVDLQADQQNVSNARSTWQRTVEVISNRIQTCKGYEANIKTWGQRIPYLQQEIPRKQIERDTIYDELMRGLYCSQCSRSATELGGMVSFQAHLVEVKGVQKRLSPQEIAQKIAPYDNALDALKREYADIQPKYAAQKSAREACGGALWQLGMQLLNEGRDEEWWRNRYLDDTIVSYREKMGDMEREVNRTHQDYQAAANDPSSNQMMVASYQEVRDSWIRKIQGVLSEAQCQPQLHQSEFNTFVNEFQAALSRLRIEIRVLSEDPQYGSDSHLENVFDCPIFKLQSEPFFELPQSVLTVINARSFEQTRDFSSQQIDPPADGLTACPVPPKARSGVHRFKFR